MTRDSRVKVINLAQRCSRQLNEDVAAAPATSEKLTSRREFIRLSGQGLGLLTLGNLIPAVLPMPLVARGVSKDPNHNILVLVHLVGGNDGLNTVVPFADELYYRLRPTLALDEEQVLKLDDFHGLHPACLGLHRLYNDGKLAVIQGVGYAHPNRSHFGSTEIWETGGLAELPQKTGWLGRFIDETVTRSSLLEDPVAVHFSHQTPCSLVGEIDHAIYGFNQVTPVNQPFDQRIKSVSDSHRPNFRYPDTRFGNSLQKIAALISAGTNTRIFHVSLSGFDTHNHQSNPHHNLLKTLSDGLMAFQVDLQSVKHANRVLTMTYSEFGRRAAENEMRGTDHGTAAPMFIMGSCINGGLHGTAPLLPTGSQQDLSHNIEHRQVYATILDKWLGHSSLSVRNTARPSLNFI